METVFAGLISAIFSFWVWELKTQLQSLRQVGPVHASGFGHVELPGSGSDTHMARQVVSDDTVKHGAPESRLVRENGVPTWTIDA